nr:hypothetical protein B0A51_11588 [Rachicladosporium sp. CCFEE 5018]
MGYAMKPAFYQELDPLIFEHDTRGAQPPKGEVACLITKEGIPSLFVESRQVWPEPNVVPSSSATRSATGNRGEQSAEPSQGNDKDTGYVDEEEAENDEDDGDDEDDEDDEDVESGDEGDSEPEQSTSSAPV